MRSDKEITILLLSGLEHAIVTNDTGLSACLADLALDLSTGDYPTVCAVIIDGDHGARCALPAPTHLDARCLRVPAGAPPEPLADEMIAQMVLLRRDVMDALILDLKGLRAVRANDLCLRRTDSRWELAAADISPWAVLRRLTRGLISRYVAADVLDWQQIEFLRGDPRAAAAGRDYHRRVARLQPTAIAHLTDGLPYMHAAELLTLLPDPLAADVLEAMLPERQAQVITELDRDQAARLIAEMATDCAADLLGQLDLADATDLLDAVPADRARLISDLLRYPPDSAGGIMTNEFIAAPVTQTVSGVLDYIRPELARPDFAYFVYLVDDQCSRRLRGVVTLRDLNLAEPATPVRDVMQQDLLTVAPLAPALEAAYMLADRGLNALPVTEPDGTLLGIVTLDKAIAQILPEACRDRVPQVFS